jgi:polo-like kinase 1
MLAGRLVPRAISVPQILIRKSHSEPDVVYQRHEELGRGGFAAVYRVTNEATGEDFALKAISKERVSKPKTFEKLKSEISIQSTLNHPNILKSFDSFEDTTNHYIVLELCPGWSVRNRLRRAGHLSELETRSILREVIAGVCYLHDNRIIHRDLKLENFLFAEDGRLKIADFGLSAKLDYDDERKFTVCGTPNYLSPELLLAANKGHSYAVDIWTIGVCAFAMLTGHPPFETGRTKLTYEHIKNCQYRFPAHIRLSAAAKDFVQCILQIRPECRPSAQDLATHPFITAESEEVALRPRLQLPDRGLVNKAPPPRTRANPVPEVVPNRVLVKPVLPKTIIPPSHCVARFCDHSTKYGLGYLLMDGTVGACFNDLTRMAMDPHEIFVQYWETYQTMVPEVMDPVIGPEAKKLSILKKFSESLKKTKSMFQMPNQRYSQKTPLHHVKYWMRNAQATLFRMDDRNIQLNFEDRCKVVIFWNTKQMIMVQKISEPGRVISLTELVENDRFREEHRRFGIAKAMLAEMSQREV